MGGAMEPKIVSLSVPAEAKFARCVRMTAATLAVNCDMSVDDVEDIRMIAEEGFVYACATAPQAVDISFALSAGTMSMNFSLGETEADDSETELVRILLLAISDEFRISEDGRTLVLSKSDGRHV